MRTRTSAAARFEALDDQIPKAMKSLARLLLLACLLLSFGLVLPVTAQTTFTVNVTGDGADTAPGDGVCLTGVGNCSLRAAIEEANALPGTDVIHFSIGGTGPHVLLPPSALPPITETVTIDGSTQPGNAGVCTTAIPNRPAYRIVLNGTIAGAGVDGLKLLGGSDNSVIRGLNIRNFDGNGIYMFFSQRSLVQCSFIGTNAIGTTAAANGENGISMDSGARFNIVGTDGDGVGDAFEGNLISGNENLGVSTFRDAVVAGNFIGTDKSGTTALPNRLEGLDVSYDVLVGTNGDGVSDAFESNLISGNTRSGIEYQNDITGSVVAGNRIGTDLTGMLPLGNGSHGVRIRNNTHGNRIGTNGDGVNDDAEANTIAFNTLNGVTIDHKSSLENAILGNAIFANGKLGINLSGTTVNDADDDDETANRGQNHPEIASAFIPGNNLILTYLVDTDPTNATYPLRIEFFLADADSSEGQTFLGAVEYAQDDAQQQVTASFTPAVAVSLGDVLVTTATDADGNTSEFSASMTVATPMFTVNTTTDEADASPGDGNCETALGDCTLRAAIEEANAVNGSTDILFNIAGTAPHVIAPATELPTITSPVVIDGSTQPGNEAVCTSVIPDRPAYAIVLDGGSIGGDADGLTLEAGSDGSVIRGLNIRSFKYINQAAIRIYGSNNSIQCNTIGLNEDGTSILANDHGVALLVDASNNVVGTDGDGVDDAFEGNLISGNLLTGITMADGLYKTGSSTAVVGNVVAGNYIGTDKSGTLALGNRRGINIINGASNNRIGTNADGTSDTAEGNLISGNNTGVQLGITTGNVVAGNLIGTDASGTNALGNEYGVLITLGVANRVGSDADGNLDEVEGNTIAFNTRDGVLMAGDASSLGNTVQGNRFFENGGLGIDLKGGTEDPNGVTANDTDDSDTGPNNLQNTPVILAAEAENPGLNVSYRIDTATNNAAYPFRVEFFLADADGEEGQTFLIADNYIIQNAQQVARFRVPQITNVSPGNVLVATAIDANGNTSEFSAPIIVSGEQEEFEVAVNLWLEGPWNGTDMNTDLSEVLPETDPYFGSETIDPDFFTTPEGQEVVDWVWLELRSDESTVAYQAPGLLLSEGFVYGLFEEPEPGFYYIVVGHRNHLPVMSATPVDCTGSECSYDFTASQAQAYGTNAMQDLAGDGSGPFALTAADADANGQVQASDKNNYFTAQVGLSGYHEADFDLNGEVQASDKNAYFTKNVGLGTQVPPASPPAPAAKTDTATTPLPASRRLLVKSQ